MVKIINEILSMEIKRITNGQIAGLFCCTLSIMSIIELLIIKYSIVLIGDVTFNIIFTGVIMFFIGLWIYNKYKFNYTL